METPLTPDAAPGHDWPTRLLWTLVGVALLSWSFEILNTGWNFAWAAATAVLVGGWGLVTIMAGVAAPPSLSRRVRDVCGWVTMLVGLLALLAWTLLTIRNGNGYGTDELAFNQYAASLVRHGLNPYAHTMKPALSMFSVGEHGITHTLSGQVVTQLSYPALSFLVYVPFLALGWSNQLGIGVDLIGWSLSILLMFAMLPRTVRPAALLIGMTSAYVTLSNVGLTDLTFMPLLLIAAFRWDRFGRDWRSWIGPAAMGLALAAKQTAWPILPFILIALALDGGGRGRDLDLRRAGRYLAVVVVAFLIPNVPFIVSSPIDWWHGVWTPLVKDLVPGGQGTVALSMLVHHGGGSLRAFTILGLLTVLWLLVVYIGTYPLLRATTFFLPSIAYFFAARSYAIYLIALIPPMLVAALTAGPDRTMAAADMSTDGATSGAGDWRKVFRARGWAYATAGLVVLWLGAGIDALTATPPMRLTILGVKVIADSGGEQEMTVNVTNRSGATVRPHFSLQTGSSVTNFWDILRGPATLRPSQSYTYTLIAPDAGAQEPIDAGLRMVAFTTNPASISVSQRYRPALWSTEFVPEYSDITAPVGQTTTIGVQLVNRISSPLRIGGVPVTLRALKVQGGSTATINGGAVGTAAVVRTNANGVADFQITGTSAGDYPASFAATLPSGGRWGYTFTTPAPLTIRIVRRSAAG